MMWFETCTWICFIKNDFKRVLTDQGMSDYGPTSYSVALCELCSAF